jgi:ABC-2 type transport system ATP-binding protein
MDEAEHCHRLALIQRGKIIAYGSPQQIKGEMMRGQVLEIEPDDTVGAVKILRSAHEDGELSLEEVALYGSLIHVVAQDIEALKDPIADQLRQAGIEILSMDRIEPSLEDVFISSMNIGG